jgi:hypothetical protein
MSEIGLTEEVVVVLLFVHAVAAARINKNVENNFINHLRR